MSTSSTRVIAHERAGECRRWEAPSVTAAGAAPSSKASRPDLLTAEKLEAIHNQAYAEGYELGCQAGREAGEGEIRARVATLDTVLGRLSKPLADLDEAVEQELVTLAITLARQIIRRELKRAPDEILAVVREAMAALPVGARDVRMHLHAEDASVVRDSLALNETDPGWRIVEDPVLQRGDCRVEAEASRVDAKLETRLNAVIAAMLGDERAHDSASRGGDPAQ